jgi:alkyl hydroperoxide reductase subunit AhpC
MTSSTTIGSRAPRFSLPAVDGNGVARSDIRLEDYLDRWLVLLFYPRDFSLI